MFFLQLILYFIISLNKVQCKASYSSVPFPHLKTKARMSEIEVQSAYRCRLNVCSAKVLAEMYKCITSFVSERIAIAEDLKASPDPKFFSISEVENICFMYMCVPVFNNCMLEEFKLTSETMQMLCDLYNFVKMKSTRSESAFAMIERQSHAFSRIEPETPSDTLDALCSFLIFLSESMPAMFALVRGGISLARTLLLASKDGDMTNYFTEFHLQEGKEVQSILVLVGMILGSIRACVGLAQLKDNEDNMIQAITEQALKENKGAAEAAERLMQELSIGAHEKIGRKKKKADVRQ